MLQNLKIIGITIVSSISGLAGVLYGMNLNAQLNDLKSNFNATASGLSATLTDTKSITRVSEANIIIQPTFPDGEVEVYINDRLIKTVLVNAGVINTTIPLMSGVNRISINQKLSKLWMSTETQEQKVKNILYAPSSASAICSDLSISYSASRRGTCSHHGGVAEWL